MARALSPEKRRLILESATREIAEKGLAASIAAIAKGAGLAEGTIFTYFSSKDDLLNELYVSLKTEAYGRIHAGFPNDAALRERAQHIWTEYLRWAMEKPFERKVSLLLNLSSIISPVNRERVDTKRGAVSQTLREIEQHGLFRELPAGFASSAMRAMQEAVMETIGESRRNRERLIGNAFKAFWRIVE
jgi:AcrR family transcriptional regulator